MNPEHLRTFLAVQKHLNFTRAAEALFLSQPAVSRQIKQLERRLGVAVFEQIGKSLHLTEAGRILVPEAERLLGNIERVAEVVRRHRSAESGQLRVGASTTPGLYLLPSALGRFHRKYPKVEFHYVVEKSMSIEQRILANELDLGFVGGHITGDNLLLQKVADDDIVCFAGPAHPLARRRRIDPRTLKGETLVTFPRGSATRKLSEAWLTRAGGEIERIIELETPEAIRTLVGAGFGISLLSIHSVAREFRRRSLRRLPLAGLRLRRPIYLVRHADKYVSPVMTAFLEIVSAELGRNESARA